MASLSDQILTDSPSTDELVATVRPILAAVAKNDFELLYAVSKAMWVGNELVTKLALKGYVGSPISLEEIMGNIPKGEGKIINLKKLSDDIHPKANKPSDDYVDDDVDDDDDFDVDDDDSDDDYDDAYDDDYDDGDYSEDDLSEKIDQVVNIKNNVKKSEDSDPSFDEKKLISWLESIFSCQREHSHKFIAKSAKSLGLVTKMSQLVKTISKLPVVVGMDMSKKDPSEDPMMVIANPGWPEKTNKPWWMTGVASN